MSDFTFVSRSCEFRPAGGAPVNGRLASITEAGAVVEVPDPFAIPDGATLTVRRRERTCRIMWRSNGQVGVRFEEAA